MAKFSLRRYDTQAKMGLIVSLLSIITMLAMAFLVFRNLDYSDFVVYYGTNRKPPLFLSAAVTLLLAAIGFGLGFNSIGQRRNDKQKLSWIAFFISAGVVCLTLALLCFFRLRGEMVIVAE